MATITVLSLIALFIVPVLWFLSIKLTRFQRMMDKLPTPSSLPILGHAHLLPINPHEFYMKFNVMCEEFRKGGIFKLHFGFLRKMIVVGKADVVEKLLHSSKHIRKSDLYEFVVPWLGTGLLTATGDKWRRRRRLITPSFHFKILQEFLIVMNEQTDVMISNLKSKHVGKSSFDMCPYITSCALDIICMTAMGKNVNAQQDADSEYVKAVYKASELIHVRQFRPWLWPDVIYSCLPAGKEWKRILGTLHSFTNSVITDRIQEHKGKNRDIADTSLDTDIGRKKKHAFLDNLLEQAEENNLSLEDIREEVDTFMFEGHDTTAAGIAWATHLLAEHPEIQTKVQDELDEVFGDSDRELEFDDLANLKYLECVIKESLRMFPSVPMIGRELEEDVDLGGYACPKGAQVLIVITQLNSDPDYFPEPEKFDPDRFLIENSSGRHPFAYLPFSAGPRNCIGQKFAMMEEKVLLSALLRNFNIESVQRTPEVEPCSELILRPGNGVHCKITHRVK